jgi:hypothetical protein
MKPGGECRVATKGCDLAVDLKKRLLHEVFGEREISHHAHANCEDPPLVLQVEF